LAIVAVWPALWVNPLGTLREVYAGAMRQSGNPHELSNYFWFAIRPDPGPAFYPVAWAFRASPWVFLGLIGLIAARRYRPAAGWGWAAALFILGYALFMTVSEKKFDRYLLPVFPWVDALAAAGGVGLMTAMGAWRARRGSPESPAAKAGRLRRACGARQSRPSAAGKPHDDASLAREGGLGNRSLPALAAGDSGGSISAGALAWAALIILVAQLALILPSRPYYLAYYNPLVGGGRAAQRVLLIGWGEGLNLAADYLNAKPSATSLHVAAQSSNEFGAFFTGHTTVLGERPVIEPDYFVLYAGQAQRLFVPEITGPLLEETPEHIVTVNGVEYARIYRNDFYQKETKRLLKVIEGQSDPDSTAVLVNWTASWPKDYGGAMYVECLATPGRDDYVLSALQRITERHKRIWLLLYPDASPDLDRRLKNWLAEYAVREQELRAGDVRAISYHLRPETRFIPARSQHEAGHLLNKQIRLLGYDLPQDAVTPGGEFYVRLYWQAIQFTDARYKVFVHLLGPDGQLVAQQDAEPQGGGWPTTHWLPGEMLVDDYALAVPADAPPGDYALAVGMYRLDNMERLPAVDSQGQRQPDDRIILVSGIENK